MKKTQEEKDEIRRKTEAARKPDKDRSAHDAKRGGQLPSLKDLSSEWPTYEQVMDFGNLVDLDANDRAGAIMTSALVEQSLLIALDAFLPRLDKRTLKEWFEDGNAQFRSFGARIKLGRALAIYGPKTEKDLTVIKNVRNAFAHRSLPLDFSHPSLQKEISKLKAKDGNMRAASIYYDNCLRLTVWFSEVSKEQLKKPTFIRLP